jgi:hypothetical protein
MSGERHSGDRHPGRLAVPAVRDLSPYVPGKPISELERELGIRDIVKLASNENPYGPSPRTLAAMRAALDEVWLYPDGSCHELKQGLARHLGVDATCLTLGNGSNDLLVLLAEAFLTPSHSAVYSQYGFAIYPLVTRARPARGRSKCRRWAARAACRSVTIWERWRRRSPRTRAWCSSPIPTIPPAPGRRPPRSSALLERAPAEHAGGAR